MKRFEMKEQWKEQRVAYPKFQSGSAVHPKQWKLERVTRRWIYGKNISGVVCAWKT
jgi:hypothetical protein